jgi:lipoprotein LprG
VHFRVTTNGSLPGLPIREVDGTVHTQPGRGFARGQADVQRGGHRRQYTFVLSGDTLRLRSTGRPEVLRPAPERFTPARLLDPGGGLQRLLRAATDLHTEGRERLHDIATYRVNGALPARAVGALLPGVRTRVDAKFWISAASPHRLMRMWVQVPPRRTNAGAVVIEMALSKHNRVPGTKRPVVTTTTG